ncbi:MAG: hypothetical protein U0871_05925 [Gemmataceae bacterium]
MTRSRAWLPWVILAPVAVLLLVCLGKAAWWWAASDGPLVLRYNRYTARAGGVVVTIDVEDELIECSTVNYAVTDAGRPVVAATYLGRDYGRVGLTHAVVNGVLVVYSAHHPRSAVIAYDPATGHYYPCDGHPPAERTAIREGLLAKIGRPPAAMELREWGMWLTEASP